MLILFKKKSLKTQERHDKFSFRVREQKQLWQEMFYQPKRNLATEALCCISFSEGHIIQPNQSCCVQRWCLFNYFGADRQPGLDATNSVALWIKWCSFVEVVLKKVHNPLLSELISLVLAVCVTQQDEQPLHSSCSFICPAAINLKAVLNAIFCASPPAIHGLSWPTWKVWCHNDPQPNIPELMTADCQHGVWAEGKTHEEPDPCWHSKLNDSIPQTQRWPQLLCTV